MSSQVEEKLTVLSNKFLRNLYKAVGISGLFLFLLFVLISYNLSCQTFTFFYPLQNVMVLPDEPRTNSSPTNITHIVFGISGSAKAWNNRKPYIESWWQPNTTQGYLFLDKPPDPSLLPWPSSSPPFRISEDTSVFRVHSNHIAPSVIRIARVIKEVFRETNRGVRWYVMGDDDTIFFLDNLVELLGKYDHEKYFYIGGISECVKSNYDFSFEMAYGGAGFALSYPLAAALVKILDKCIDRYPFLYTSDYILQSCLADLGVSLTLEKGFHQMDLLNDLSGFLSAHPASPLISLHHLDLNVVHPLFPSMSRHESLNHLMKAAKLDQSRLLQQTICYHRQTNWSFSLSWGYSAHVYEEIHSPSYLKRPLETFRPWQKKARKPLYMFNTRPLTSDSCEVPHVFFLDSIEKTRGEEIVTSYVRSSPRGLLACSSSGNHSADHIAKIIVFSSATKLDKAEPRRECCDIVYETGMNVAQIKLRACEREEMVGAQSYI